MYICYDMRVTVAVFGLVTSATLALIALVSPSKLRDTIHSFRDGKRLHERRRDNTRLKKRAGGDGQTTRTFDAATTLPSPCASVSQ